MPAAQPSPTRHFRRADFHRRRRLHLLRASLPGKWIQAFEELHPELHFTYQGVGSEEGIRLVSERSVDFAGSDAFLTDEQMAVTHVHFDHYATVLGGVVPAYNLAEGARDRRFTPEVLAAI